MILLATRNQDAFLGLLNHYAELENPLKKDVDRLVAAIRHVLRCPGAVEAEINALLGQIFQLRLKAIFWMATHEELLLSEVNDEVLAEFQEVRQRTRYHVLFENILFAIRSLERVRESLAASGMLTQDSLTDEKVLKSNLTFEQFAGSLAIGIPDGEQAQSILDWMSASLRIEFGILAGAIIDDEQIDISKSVVDELAFVVADAAQEYLAIASELGILTKRSRARKFGKIGAKLSLDESDQDLADLGLESFFNELK
jgi:hypothetical protein